MKKEVLKAIKNILKVKIDYSNYGMLSCERIDHADILTLERNGIVIYFERKYNGVYNAIVKENEVIGVIKQRYATKKINGMYKQLQPVIEWNEIK